MDIVLGTMKFRDLLLSKFSVFVNSVVQNVGNNIRVKI